MCSGTPGRGLRLLIEPPLELWDGTVLQTPTAWFVAMDLARRYRSSKPPSRACLVLGRWPHVHLNTCCCVPCSSLTLPGARTSCLGSASVYFKLLLKNRCKTFFSSFLFSLLPVQRDWSASHRPRLVPRQPLSCNVCEDLAPHQGGCVGV